MKQNATSEQLKQRKSIAAAEREENQRFALNNINILSSDAFSSILIQI